MGNFFCFTITILCHCGSYKRTVLNTSNHLLHPLLFYFLILGYLDHKGLNAVFKSFIYSS